MIERDEFDASRIVNPFWDKKPKLYALVDCKCGGTQDGGDVVQMYIGAVGRGFWCIRCRKCKRIAKAPKELEAVAKWNNGEIENG